MSSMDEYGHFAKCLTRWRSAIGQSQAQLAALIGCHRTLISHVESGSKEPTPEFMRDVITAAEQPWKAQLREARQADQDTADQAAALKVA